MTKISNATVEIVCYFLSHKYYVVKIEATHFSREEKKIYFIMRQNSAKINPNCKRQQCKNNI